MKIFVLAENHVEFEVFLQENTLGFSRRDFIYVTDPDLLRGLTFPKIIMLERHYKHENSSRIQEELQFLRLSQRL